MDRDLALVVDDVSAPRILTEMLDMDLGSTRVYCFRHDGGNESQGEEKVGVRVMATVTLRVRLRVSG